MPRDLTPELRCIASRDAADGVERAVVGAVISDRGAVLVLQRRLDEEFLPGLWELPSGRVEAGEDLVTALRREVAEETGLDVDVVTGYLGSFDYVSAGGARTRQHTFAVTVVEPEPLHLTEHADHAWITAPDERPVSRNVAVLLAKHLTAA
ncbi:NUDIX hydrolase [Streptoalloteichus hindustanus]|uniref:8-oxo-dGTP diphosphatase n=1 Tax=Streptoalloteichus hindustanus TaxID=2017 RepID=A0A1M5DNK4_STRHI|nr:NUDIX domain-containing protein [Streptoalloteichus hindustanus]SHF68362.1 8-oxo-dGTP diphosphatase [Streptoalloteichus hindustanus]